METARLNTKNRLFGTNVHPNPECDQMPLVNDPDPTFDIYTGCLNPLDRDYWNARLDQRTFLLERPPVHHIYYPQSTNLCTFKPGCTPPILTDPKLEQASQNYYNRYLKPRDPNLGLPTTNNQFCSASQMCNPVGSLPKETYNTGTCGYSDSQVPTCFGTDHLPRYPSGPAGRQAVKDMYDRCSQKYPLSGYEPAVGGVNYNVESESALRRLDHYCPTDVQDRRVKLSQISSNTLDQAKVYHPDCVKPLPGIYTPLVWRNFTRMKNRYLLEDISDEANLTECPN